jgi:hypothetical protein
MSGLAEYFPEFQGAGAQVTPASIDRYEVYTILSPMIGTFSWGTAEGTSTQSPTFAFSQIIPDYPRSVRVAIAAASGSTTGGTFKLTGKNQFGEVISESFIVATAADGGTTLGTKVFGQFTAFTGTIGTVDAGVGTVVLSPNAAGTTALFGLPCKLGGTADLIMMTMGSTGVAKACNGGTLGGYVNLAQHAIKAPNTITTGAADPSWIQVWYKPSWDNSQKPKMAAMKQI